MKDDFQMMFRRIPSAHPCGIVNGVLWEHFKKKYHRIYGADVVQQWNEDEVVVWLDTCYDYLLAELNKENGDGI